MTEQSTEQLQGWIRRFWWLFVLLGIILLLLCVFIGPGKALFFPAESPTQEVTSSPTEASTPPPTEQPTETEQATETGQATTPEATETEVATPTEPPTEQPTPTAEATQIIAVSTGVPTEAPTETQAACKMDPTDGVCDYACGENPTNDQACGPLPNCGTDCSINGGYCGDGSNGLFCDNGRCNGVQCQPSRKCDVNTSRKCCSKAGGTWNTDGGGCFFPTQPPAG